MHLLSFSSHIFLFLKAHFFEIHCLAYLNPIPYDNILNTRYRLVQVRTNKIFRAEGRLYVYILILPNNLA